MNSTRSTLLKGDKVDSVALAPYTRATKSTVSATELTVSATKSTATSCRIKVVADLLPKPATKSTVLATVDFVASFSNNRLSRQCVPGFIGRHVSCQDCNLVDLTAQYGVNIVC